MRVDGVVDQRLDPYSATEAAANLMLYNYRLLGSWPLAVTAYNHGPGGLRRAQDELGTSNIAVIVKRYQGATFGFASRNFYVAFLAALEVDRNAEKYFGPLTHLPETQSTVVTLPDYVAVDALARAFKADLGALRVLNPALRPPIWNKTRLVPRGYELRIPGSPPPADISASWARLTPAERFVAQRNDGAHRARRGETFASIAAVSGVTLNRLLAANGLSAPRELARGETVRIPMPASRAEGSAAGVVAASLPVVEAPAEPAAAEPAVARLAPPKEPVSERQAETTALLPAAAPSGNGDTTDYSVGADNTVVVQAAETLGHFADWSKVSSASLRALNRLHKNAMVTLGHKVKAGSIAGQRGAIRGGAARLPSATAGELLCHPQDLGYGKLRGEERRIAMDHRAATCGLACVAGCRIQPRCGLRRCSTRRDDCLAAGRGHQSSVRPRECK